MITDIKYYNDVLLIKLCRLHDIHEETRRKLIINQRIRKIRTIDNYLENIATLMNIKKEPNRQNKARKKKLRSKLKS